MKFIRLSMVNWFKWSTFYRSKIELLKKLRWFFSFILIEIQHNKFNFIHSFVEMEFGRIVWICTPYKKGNKKNSGYVVKYILTSSRTQNVNYSIFNQNITFYVQSGNSFYWFWIPNVVKLFFMKEWVSCIKGKENNICPFMTYNCVWYARIYIIYLCVYISEREREIKKGKK